MKKLRHFVTLADGRELRVEGELSRDNPIPREAFAAAINLYWRRAQEEFARERVPLTPLKIEKILADFAEGRRDKIDPRLYLAALLALFTALAIPADDDDEPWRCVHHALSAGLMFMQLEAVASRQYGDDAARSRAFSASRARSLLMQRRVDALARAIETGDVLPEVAAIVAWRRDDSTHASKVKARRDLKAALGRVKSLQRPRRAN
jgi:hypothetical protein